MSTNFHTVMVIVVRRIFADLVEVIIRCWLVVFSVSTPHGRCVCGCSPTHLPPGVKTEKTIS